jgi:hypothetical protein
LNTNGSTYQRKERFAPLQEGFAQFRSYLFFLSLIVAACCWTLVSFRDDISQQISSFAVEKLNHDLQPCGWKLQVGSTKLISASQFLVTDISLIAPGRNEPGVSIESMVINLSSPWAEGKEEIPLAKSLVVDQSTIRIHTSNLNPDD